jgi:hypothetical protein
MYVYHTSITSSYIIHNYQFINYRQYLSTIYIYAHQNISSTLPMDCHVAAPQEIGPFLLNQSLKWSWHHPAGRFHTLTWGTAIDHQMKLRWRKIWGRFLQGARHDCPCKHYHFWLVLFDQFKYHFLGICLATKAPIADNQPLKSWKSLFTPSPLVFACDDTSIHSYLVPGNELSWFLSSFSRVDGDNLVGGLEPFFSIYWE